MTIDPLGAGLGAVALVQGRIEAFLKSNEVKNAFQELRAELQRSHEIPPGDHEAVWREVQGLRVDPDFLGALFAYLDSGEQQALGRMRARLMQLLRLEEQAVSRDTVADLTVGIVERNRHLMKKSALEALHLDHLILEDRVEEVRAGVESMRTEQRELGERLSAQLQEPQARTVAGVRLVDRETDFAHVLEKLSEYSPEEAGLLQAAIEAGGSERVAKLIRAPQPWLESGSAQLWVSAARVAQRGNHYEEAEAAFVRAADHPGVDDRVRQLMRASSMARVRGDDTHGQELLAQAQALSPRHPAVLVAEARQSEDADVMIGFLEGVEGLDDAQTAEVQATLCGAYLTKGELEKAREALAIAREADARSVGVREMSAMFALEIARRSLSDDRQPDRRSLVEAGEQFAELVREVLDEARPDEAGAVAVRAIEAFLLADEGGRADDLFALLLDEPRTYRDSETAKRLGEAAVHAQRADLVDRFLPDDSDEIARLFRAEATVLRSQEGRHASVEALRELMRGAAEEPVRLRAALAILNACTLDPEVQWDDDAEAVVEQHRPWVVARLKAEYLETAGDRGAAERVLRPYQAQPSVMRYLVGLAARGEDFEKALRLSERLLDAGPDERDRIRHCELLRAVGDRDRARAEFLALARDPKMSERERSAAYGEASKLLEQDGDLTGLERTAKEWFENLGNDEDAGWLRLYALMRLTRFEDAFWAWQETPLAPGSEQQAALLGQLVALCDEPVSALARIADLADQHPESERLQLLLVTTALGRGEGDDIPQALEERIRSVIATFPERFPESTALRAIEVDMDDPVKSLTEFTRRSHGARQDQLRDLERQIARGETALALLAALAGRSTGEIWLLYGALPLAYGDSATHDADRQAAAAALGMSAALWDEGALFVVGGLGGEIADLVVNALPASRIVQSVLDTAAGALMDPATGSSERLIYDETADEVFRVALSSDEIEREQARAAGTLELARRLRVTADEDPGGAQTDERLQALVRDDVGPFKNWAAGMIAAGRLGLPVYSDDRFVRNAARGMGLQAFGTLALVDALADRQEIAPEQRAEIRAVLHRSGGWGMRLSPEELKRFGAAADWDLTRGLAATFRDVTTWRREPRVLLDAILPFLQEVFDVAPQHFEIWVNRLLDALTQASVRKDDGELSTALVFFALDVLSEPPILSDQCLQRFIEALRGVPWYLRLKRGDDDIVLPALAMLLKIAQPESKQVAAALFKRAISRLSDKDRKRAVAAFVR